MIMGLLIYTIPLLMLATILWTTSTVARYYLKFLVFVVVSVVSACGPIPIMLLSPRDSKNALIPAAGLRMCCRFMGIKYSVEGHEHIVRDSGCVVLINHQSFLDLIVLACLWPIMPNSTVISKKEIFYLQPFGLASWLWGTIFIDRVNVKEAQKQVNKTAEYIKENQSRVLMFPEGTRNGTKKLLPFKKGAFHLAIASQCPIQPVAVCRYTFLGNQRFDSGRIKIKILPHISTKGKTQEDLQQIIDQAYEVMSENVNLLSSVEEEKNANYKLKAN